jgi:hypothetical protein
MPPAALPLSTPPTGRRQNRLQIRPSRHHLMGGEHRETGDSICRRWDVDATRTISPLPLTRTRLSSCPLSRPPGVNSPPTSPSRYRSPANRTRPRRPPCPRLPGVPPQPVLSTRRCRRGRGLPLSLAGNPACRYRRRRLARPHRPLARRAPPARVAAASPSPRRPLVALRQAASWLWAPCRLHRLTGWTKMRSPAPHLKVGYRQIPHPLL